MSTTRASTPLIPRKPRGKYQSLFVGAAVAATLGASAVGCSFGWDSYDPRLGSGGATSTGEGGSGPTTGIGGASSTVTGAVTATVTSGASSSTGTGMGGASS